MSRRPSVILLNDILESIAKTQIYTRGMNKKSFLSDQKTIDSVVRNLEIIGEAASRLPKNIYALFPDIPWKQIIGLRHRIVHDYFDVDREIVWEIIRRDLPKLEPKIKKLKKNSSLEKN